MDPLDRKKKFHKARDTTLNKTETSDNYALFLDLNLSKFNDIISTKIYDQLLVL